MHIKTLALMYTIGTVHDNEKVLNSLQAQDVILTQFLKACFLITLFSNTGYW